ncbi:MAG: type II secretion system F family protein [Planctomycetaceae bacterium]
MRLIRRIFRQIFDFSDRTGAARRGALLWIIVIAVEKQLRLIPVLEAYAKDAGPGWGSPALRIVAGLRSGLSLADAIQAVPDAVPRSAVLAAQVGSESGTLGPALRIAAEAHSARQSDASKSVGGFVGYIAALALIITLITSFVMVYIIPKLLMIFQDFDMELPVMTRFILHVSDWMISYFYLLIPLVALFCVALAAFYSANRADATAFAWLRHRFPSRWFPDVERLLSVVVQAGRPIDSALSSLAAHHPNSSVRATLNRLQSDVNSGNSLWGGLAERGLIRRADAAVLVAAERVGNLPWALRNVADNSERRADFRLRLLIEFIEPAAIVGVGVIVGSIVIGLLLPLLKLVGGLS